MKKTWKNSKNQKIMFFPMSAYQDASLEYNQLNIKICDFFPLGAFGCFLTNVIVKGNTNNIMPESYAGLHKLI